jgi:aromatic ring-cleaving dioxygenase
MATERQPYHAHIYFDPRERAAADRLRQRLSERKGVREFASLVFVGELREEPVGPHPQGQFEIHFREDALPQVRGLLRATGFTVLVHPLTDDDQVRGLLRATGFTVLVHPLTDDDLADHTSLGEWLGQPLPLDLSVLDPPGMNKGVARFGKSDF